MVESIKMVLALEMSIQMVLTMVSSKYKNGSGFGDEYTKRSGYGVDKVLKVFPIVKMDLAMGTRKY